MSDLPRGTVTFLFTDIEGSTRLLKSFGDGYAEVLEEHQRILRAAFEQSGGREIDTQGDAFFVAFSRAKDAAAAALAGQTGLAAHEWPEGAHVRVRMGLHTAEPVVGEDRYVGLGVHRAARICAAGHGGQVLLSGATRELVEDDLPCWCPTARPRPPQAEGHSIGWSTSSSSSETVFRQISHRSGRLPISPTRRRHSPAARTRSRLQPRLTVEPGRWSRRRILTVLLALLVIAVAIAAAIRLPAPRVEQVTVVPDSLAVVDPVANRIVDDVIPLGEAPGPIGLGEDGLWILSLNSKTLASVDPITRELRSTTGIGGTPTNMAVARREVWISDSCNSNTNPALIRYEADHPRTSKRCLCRRPRANGRRSRQSRAV